MTTVATTIDELRAESRAGIRDILRQPMAVSALVALTLIALGSVLAPWLTPYDPLAQNLQAVQQLPSGAHWLGTDSLGRDVLSRLMWGGQPSLAGALVATVVYATLGVTFGLMAGYSSGTLDRWISSAVDILMSLPGIVIMFAVIAVFDNSLTAAMVTLGVFASGGPVRVVRAVTRSTKEELYVSAARVTGISTGRIMLRHIAPRLVGPVVVQVSLFAGIALVVQSGLGFLGLGVAEPNPSWGGMVAEAARLLITFPWLLVPSGGIIAVTVLALGLVGDAVRDSNAGVRSKRARPMSAAHPSPAAQVLPAERPEALLDVAGLVIGFEGEAARKEVVHGVSFAISTGELVGLVGESGSGKTITALSLMGLLPQTGAMTAGRFRFAGIDLSAGTPAAFRRIRGGGIGLISQEPMVALDPVFTVGHQLRSVLRAQTDLRGSALRRRALELLSDVKLPDPAGIAKRYPHELSGGMAQRVVIAVALAGRPQLLIADEPTTALDVTVQAEILDLLRQLRDRYGMAIVLVTHDLGVVADFCERVYVLQHGHIVEEKGTVELFAHPQHEHTRALIAATPSLVPIDRKRPIERHEGQVNHA